MIKQKPLKYAAFFIVKKNHYTPLLLMRISRYNRRA